MHAPDRVERGENRAFLPAVDVRGMFACDRNASVDRAQIRIMFFAHIVGPVGEAAHRERRTMPGDGNAVFELFAILRMDLRALFDRGAHALLRRHRGELERVGAEHVGAEQHAFAAEVHARHRVGDLLDRQIGERDAAVDALVLLPEAALHLQADLHRRRVGHRADRSLHSLAGFERNLREDRQRYRAQAPIGLCLRRRAAAACVDPGDTDATLVLIDRSNLGIKLHKRRDFAVQRHRDAIHAADRLEHRRRQVVVDRRVQIFPQS